jgi:hypothetical protein
MDSKNRDVDTSTRAYMTRFGVDWRSEAFQTEYFSYRDFWSPVQGNGMLPDAVLFEMAYRHRPKPEPKEEPAPQTKKAGKAA